ncbi:DUF58 domain-containing protein [Sulfuriroseicoccus oceanibius]|uniref:DUF58 domain-containing protein n=1 Tax=Sulfuriroseicoccus oceanibius TaxID=2707525 RepID=A0A6B3LB98_9BACT|nr:DUF58 domain-containing protein [Sulfuriroseicoccus oceanibius]QQL43976.1 DUF58 domain-containing protein [Sulfuriroseicoccus oceanibius]
MQDSRYKFLRPEDVKRLAHYEFGVKAMVEGYLSGRHRSKERGASIEFHEYRQYVPGDDPALVDWRVFARTDRHYLKTFEQETNMECHVFVDSSASMGFQHDGPLTKLEYASFFAACLSWLVASKNDRVSLQLFDDQIRTFIEPGSTRRHLHQLLTALEHNQPGNKTSVAEALRKAQPLLKRKGTLVVVSDFFDEPQEIFEALSPYLHRGFRVHLFHVLDPAERTLPDRGLARFVDLETRENLVVHTGSLSEAWRDGINDHVATMRRLAVSRAVDYTLAETTDSWFSLLDRLR